MKKKRSIFLIITWLFACSPLVAQTVTGSWKTIDDRTGNPKGIVNIYEEEGQLYGYVKEILEAGKENALCTACNGSRKNKPIIGMRILDKLTRKGEHRWEGSKNSLFDPEQGRYFRVKIWLDPERPNELKVRGYLLFIYRTQTWLRVTDSI